MHKTTHEVTFHIDRTQQASCLGLLQIAHKGVQPVHGHEHYSLDMMINECNVWQAF